MCNRSADMPIQVIVRAIAAGVIGTPEKAAAWALEETERLRAAEIGGPDFRKMLERNHD